jgi:hypothetical protein
MPVPAWTSTLLGLVLVLVVSSHPETPRADAAAIGGHLDFTGPGPGYMEIANDQSLSPSHSVTVEAWVYLRSYLAGFGSQDDCPVIAGKNWTQAYMLSLACGGDNVEGYINGQQVFQEGAEIPLNEWTHLALTYNGDTATTYVNGAVSATAQIDGPLGQSSDPLRIGSDVAWDRTPDGRIDDVRVWAVARTTAQIQSGMNNVPINSPGLVARWTFVNGSTEDVVSDRPGTLVGDVTAVEDEPTPTPTPSPAPTATPVPTGTPVLVGAKGDIDCNQRIDVIDVTALLREVAVTRDVPDDCNAPVTPTPTPCPTVSPTNCDIPVTPTPTPDPALPQRMNINCDEVIDERDALPLLLHVAVLNSGLADSCAPIGEGPPTGTPGSTGTPTVTPTAAGTAGPTGTLTLTPTPTATPQPVTQTPELPTPTATPTSTPTASPSAAPVPSPSPTRASTPTPTPSATPTTS